MPQTHLSDEDGIIKINQAYTQDKSLSLIIKHSTLRTVT